MDPERQGARRASMIVKSVALLSLLALAFAAACAGKDGDTAPVPPEGGPAVVACDDAGTAG